MNKITMMRINKALKNEIGGVKLVKKNNPHLPVSLIFEDDNVPLDTQEHAASIVNRFDGYSFLLRDWEE